MASAEPVRFFSIALKIGFTATPMQIGSRTLLTFVAAGPKGMGPSRLVVHRARRTTLLCAVPDPHLSLWQNAGCTFGVVGVFATLAL